MEEINIENRLEFEFAISTSPSILFYRLSTAIGLSEWFADGVSQKEDEFTFTWGNTVHTAELIGIKQNRLVRFRWLDRDGPVNPENFLEFRISVLPLTGDVALHITEQFTEEDPEEAESLWRYQVNRLRRILGA